MSVKLLTEHNLDFESFKGGCTGSVESTLVKCNVVGNQVMAQNDLKPLKIILEPSHAHHSLLRSSSLPVHQGLIFSFYTANLKRKLDASYHRFR